MLCSVRAPKGALSRVITLADYVGDALINVHVFDPQVRNLTSTHAGVHEESQDRRVPPTNKIVACCRGDGLFNWSESRTATVGPGTDGGFKMAMGCAVITRCSRRNEKNSRRTW